MNPPNFVIRKENPIGNKASPTKDNINLAILERLDYIADALYEIHKGREITHCLTLDID